ncbi:5-oxoprolinase subunit B family protein [Pantoea cypripedii]|uniref:Transporter n=1 Tax=Pantoea cypripedii TaxID=55209 RepID=A0A6B9G5V7_PANCY|nr:carboxyltransferase domain-containing protein [Pantoea cypripedii]QGY32944.1 transporter [Pantoea cypripedii]
MLQHLPRFAPAGDRFIEIELGKEMSFELNIQVHALATAIRAATINGIIELVPELASLLVSYDPDQISYDDVVKEISALYEGVQRKDVQPIASRLFHVPVLYFDPWSEECITEYRKTHPDKLTDPELLCEVNGLADRVELQQVHMGTEYWVAALGFWPGLCSLMPLDPRCRLHAPKYNPPRSWTPKGTIGLGGGLTCIYPDRTPGGYQIFARTPMPTWDRHQRLAAFTNSPALFQPGDRVRFVPIDRQEYDDIQRAVDEGDYQHPLISSEPFSVAKYRDWLTSLEKE